MFGGFSLAQCDADSGTDSPAKSSQDADMAGEDRQGKERDQAQANASAAMLADLASPTEATRKTPLKEVLATKGRNKVHKLNQQSSTASQFSVEVLECRCNNRKV